MGSLLRLSDITVISLDVEWSLGAIQILHDIKTPNPVWRDIFQIIEFSS